MLEKLGFKRRTHVGISLSANNFIELVCIDKTSKTVVKYSSGNIKYNNAIREIIDFDEFTEVIEGLFDDAGLSPHECAVTLNLPNVHFGLTPMETSSDSSYIIENLSSEIEDLYIFKRNEPAISYAILDKPSGRDQKNIVFGLIPSAIQIFRPSLKSKKFDKKVIYFGGCGNKLKGNKAVVKILNSIGVQVINPTFSCCGVPYLSRGDLNEFNNSIKSYVKIRLFRYFIVK